MRRVLPPWSSDTPFYDIYFVVRIFFPGERIENECLCETFYIIFSSVR